MGNYYTRTIRIYPKDKSKQLNKKEIINSIVNTALLDDELNVLNNEEQHLDVCFRSKNGHCDLGVNLEKVDIWEIQGGERTRITLNENKIINEFGLYFFTFDEIELKVKDESNFDDIIGDIFPQYNPQYQDFPMKIEKDKYTYPVQGIYNADSDYPIGDVKNMNRINLLNKVEFLKLKGEFNRFDGCIASSYILDNLTKVYQRFRDFELSDQKSEFYLGIEYFQLNYMGRPVLQIKNNMQNPYQKWIYSSSNWWDNCILPSWLTYQIKREYA